MELIKKELRKVNMTSALETYKTLGAKIENKGTFKKWKNLHSGGRMTVSLTVYKVDVANEEFGIYCRVYMIEDSLGRLAFASNSVSDDSVGFLTIKNWLSEKGYKTEKDFYVNDYGMTEESFEEWCNA